MLEIFVAKPISYGFIVVATAVTAIGSGVVAMVTVNDIAAYAAVITSCVVGAIFAIRTAWSTLDRAEEKTITGDYRRVRKENGHLKDRVESLETINRSQAELIDHLRAAVHDSDTRHGPVSDR